MFMEWEGKTPQDFEFQVNIEDIRENGQQVVFPVKVFLKETGEAVADLSVPLRGDFYRQLRRKGPQGEKVILEILPNRVEEQLIKLCRAERVDVETKITMHKKGKIQLPVREKKVK